MSQPGTVSAAGLVSAPSMRTDLRTLVPVAALTALYLLLTMNVPMPARLTGVAVVFGALLFAGHPRLEQVVLVLPLFFALGNREFALTPFMPTLATFAGFGAAYLWLSEKVVWNRSLEFLRHPALRLALAGMLLQLVSIAISIHFQGRFFWNAVRDGSAIYLFLPTAIIVTEVCRDERRLRMLLRSIMMTLILVGLIGLHQYMTGAGVNRSDIYSGYVFRTRISGFFPSPNVLAGYLELMTPMALAMVFAERRRLWRILSLAAFLLGFASVLFTFSRGGFFMTTGAIALLLVYHFRSRPVVPIAFAVGFIVLMAGNAETFARQLSLVTDPQEVITQPSLVHRAVTYRSFWNGFLERPLTGIGWGSEEFYWGRTTIYSFWDIRHWEGRGDIVGFGGLNSAFLNSALKGGVISIAALMLILASAAVSVWKAHKSGGGVVSAGIAAGLIAFTGHQLADNLIRWPQMNACLWMQIGLLCAMYRPGPSGGAKPAGSSDSREALGGVSGAGTGDGGESS